MKKVLLFLTVCLALFVVSCTEQEISSDNVQLKDTDPEENCPPNDANCDGIPDNQGG